MDLNSQPNPNADNTTSSQIMEVKCLSAENYPYGDNRVLNVPRNSTLVQLKNAVINHKKILSLISSYRLN